MRAARQRLDVQRLGILPVHLVAHSARHGQVAQGCCGCPLVTVKIVPHAPGATYCEAWLDERSISGGFSRARHIAARSSSAFGKLAPRDAIEGCVLSGLGSAAANFKQFQHPGMGRHSNHFPTKAL